MNTKKIPHIAVLVVICAFLFILVSARTRERTEIKMGTFVNIKLAGFIWNDFDSVFKNAFDAIENIESKASLHIPESELNILNSTAHQKPVKVSESLFSIIYTSKAVYQASGGDFDITVAPLSILWKKHIKNKSIPKRQKIKQALLLTGSDKLVLDAETRTVFFKAKGMKIDLGALAKGYAVDAAINEIKTAGFSSAMVNAGGDIYCLGKRNFLFPWRVGIRDPLDKSNISKVIYVSDKAVATSAGYEQSFLKAGKYYSHLIDPKTGYPADEEYISVTVIAESCLVADAIATAIFVGGKQAKDKLAILYPDLIVIAIEKNI